MGFINKAIYSVFIASDLACFVKQISAWVSFCSFMRENKIFYGSPNQLHYSYSMYAICWAVIANHAAFFKLSTDINCNITPRTKLNWHFSARPYD